MLEKIQEEFPEKLPIADPQDTEYEYLMDIRNK